MLCGGWCSHIAWSLCDTWLGAKKRIFETRPHPPLVSQEKMEKKLYFDPSTCLPISKPVWCLSGQLTLPHEPTGSLQHLPRKMGNKSLTHPYSLGEPNLPAPRRVSEHWQHSKTAWGGPAQKVLVLWWAACQHNSFIPQGGQTWLGNIHPLLSVPRSWGLSDWTPFSGNADTWASPLSVTETGHYNQQRLRGNSAQP